jgi:hypothetical protein
MTLSNAAIFATNAQETGAVFVHLVELSPPGQLVQRYCDQHAAVTSGGVTYQPLAFQIRLADQVEGGIPSVEFRCDDALRAVSRAFRAAAGRVPCTVRIVLADTPDIVEMQIDGSIAAVSYGDGTVTGQITQTTVDEEAFGEMTFTPGAFPGLFV